MESDMTTRFFGALCAACLLAAPCPIFAQGFMDALRFSSFEPATGTARALGLNGTMGAVGADFSVANSNPAGLAWYRKGEFSFTPGFLNAGVNSTLLSGQGNREMSENRGNFHIGSLGFVSVSDPRSPDWRAFNFAFGINRVQNFNRRLFFQGDSRGSLVDRFLEIANSDLGLDDFEAGPAFDAAAIYDLDQDGFFESDFELAPNALVRRMQTINTSGAVTELSFSFGVNYKDLLMIGAAIGVPLLNFTEEKSYDEEDFSGGIPFFDNLQYFERVATNGFGINAKVGVVVRPAQMFRIGAAVHTPTRFRLSDSFYSELTYNYTESGQAQTGYGRSPDGSFDYALLSPWRFIGNAGVILDKTGFVTLEAEYVNYGSARFRFRNFPDDEQTANNNIAVRLAPVLNIRLGGEVAYETFRFRAGVGVHPSSMALDETLNYSFSAGVGVRGQRAFADIGYRRTGLRETYVPYFTSQAPQQAVDANTARDLATLTVGFRF